MASASPLGSKAAKRDKSSTNSLLEQVERTISNRRLIGNGESLLVAVSGGVDSMVLLHLLHEMAPRHGWSLTLAHLNHQLRGRSSRADESLVRKTARRLKLECIVDHADIEQLARQKKESIEMAARAARHGFLAATARRIGASKVVLAHHADDQVELFFLRLFRGSGSEGLAGMKWASPSPDDPEIELVRPLLEVPKALLVEYASEHRITFREDATNTHLGIPRNRIRHLLLPLLTRDFQPRLHKLLARTMDILGAESDYVLGIARRWLEDKAGVRFVDLSLPVQRRVLQLQLLDHGILPEFDQLEALRLNPGSVVEFGRDSSAGNYSGKKKPLRLLIDQEGKVHITPQSDVRFSSSSKTLTLPPAESSRRQGGRTTTRVTGFAEFDGLSVSWTVCGDTPRSNPKPLPGNEMFDADRVGRRVTLRHWRPGDRFQPIGMKNPVKLQDFFVNAKVPRAKRHRLVVAVSECGAVFWVEGLRISERFKLTPDTTRSLQWVWKRL